MIKSRNIVAFWIGTFCLCLPLLGQEPVTSRIPDPRIAEQRRDIHAELPADVNLGELLGGPVEGQPHAQDDGLDTPCPCRGALVEEDPREDPLPGLVEHVGLGFGSAVLVLLAALTGWQVYTQRRVR